MDPKASAAVDSVPVAGDPWTDPESAMWMNWAWSAWVPIRDACTAAAVVGLYRVRCNGLSGLVYAGQGSVASRLRAHLAKGVKEGHRQAPYFSGDLAASWVELPGVALLNRLEHENDLIAAHVLATGRPPSAQFLG